MFKVSIKLPAQAATETEATILSWKVAAGQSFSKGDVLAEAESAKSSFEFEAPCDGQVAKLLYGEGATLAIENPVIEIETADQSMCERGEMEAPVIANVHAGEVMVVPSRATEPAAPQTVTTNIVGLGGYSPERVVTNRELLDGFDGMSEDYLFGVTGIRERRYAAPEQKPSDLAYHAAREALDKSGLSAADIGGIVVATGTPDAAMPSTACVLQQKLGIRAVPSFDISAACSGWLYGLCAAKGMVQSGMMDDVLVVGAELQSRLLDRTDKDTYFLFGDGAGAAILSRSRKGHRLCGEILLADAAGIQMARRDTPGYARAADIEHDPWIRLDGRALFRFATESFAMVIRDVVVKSGWEPGQVRWVVPHQANGRILKAAASRSGVAFDRFYLNIDHLGNTSSASIPLALREIEPGMQSGDKLVLCAVGAGITVAAVTIEW
jgi:3-oxoacyl-[acyl-carrier-protein] synthase III